MSIGSPITKRSSDRSIRQNKSMGSALPTRVLAKARKRRRKIRKT